LELATLGERRGPQGPSLALSSVIGIVLSSDRIQNGLTLVEGMGPQGGSLALSTFDNTALSLHTI
jgi:hypothetical protein